MVKYEISAFWYWQIGTDIVLLFMLRISVPQPRKIGLSSFGHRKKRADDSTDYICPLDASQAQDLLNGANRPYSGFRGLSPIFDRDPERREQVGALQIWRLHPYPTKPRQPPNDTLLLFSAIF